MLSKEEIAVILQSFHSGKISSSQATDAILARLPPTPNVAVGREEIARIIDPYFNHWCKCVAEIEAMPEGRRNDPLRRCQLKENAGARNKALATADAILRALKPQDTGSGK